MHESLVTCKSKVEHVLFTYPKTRDSDKLLWIAYLAVFHDLKKILGEKAWNQFKQVILDEQTPTMESVRRIRQKYQELGQFVGSNRKERLDEAFLIKNTIKDL